MTTANPEVKIVTTLPSDHEIVMQRTFTAPRELVFRALTEPDLISQWWGMRTSTTVVEQLDARPGGKWRFVQQAPDGTEHGFRGEFREVTPPERIIWTFEYEGMPGHVVVETMSLAESGGKTTITTHSVFDTPEERDGMIQSGMEAGANETYDRLAELLATLTGQ
jgi:uncharacterized protein YndB with AHSA1/START domain